MGTPPDFTPGAPLARVGVQQISVKGMNGDDCIGWFSSLEAHLQDLQAPITDHLAILPLPGVGVGGSEEGETAHCVRQRGWPAAACSSLVPSSESRIPGAVTNPNS